ncbi:SURF1 family protein [Psychromonas hadalis]|uniref:SURF1 family protein n=1 Tax=Psychromonas hadalis TaxID=211669 RepID=UPI0003B764D0|nr:SURF1 family protein [Psychromonas hadalis]
MPILSSSLTLIVVVTCLMLANWQHNRAQDKQTRLDNISALQAKGTIRWSDLQFLPNGLNKTGIKMQLSGHLLSDQYWLLDNRVFKQQVGFDVLAVFYPAQSNKAMIVNLGWVKAPQSRAHKAIVNLPTQKITLQVQLKQGDLAGFYLQKQVANNAPWPKRIQYIDLTIMQQESATELIDFIAYSSRAQFSLQPHYKPVVMPPEKHLAYALQWLLLAIAALVVFIFAVKPFTKNRIRLGDQLE